MTHHYPTCAIWQSGNSADCDCAGVRPWQIKKIDDGSDHPWVVLRKTGDGEEPFLYCSSHERAIQLADGMNWLGKEGLRSDV